MARRKTVPEPPSITKAEGRRRLLTLIDVARLFWLSARLKVRAARDLLLPRLMRGEIAV